MRTVLWVGALMGALLGGVVLVGGILTSNSAPQEAAVAGIACACVGVPYVLARSWDEIARRP